MWRAIAAAVLSLGLLAGPGSAQDLPQSPVLTIESDRLFADSAFGRRVAASVEAETAALTAENRRIEAELIVEEQALTDQRPSLSPTAFRDLADAFDERVSQLRREQDAKLRALGQRNEDARRQFLVAVQPVLEDIMRETGAIVIIERRNVILDAGAINVTDLAIGRIDAALADDASE